jgi:type IV secretory pathway TraG/TraD family ATPase VirD4
LLIVLDEFARLGRATMLAHGFSFVAGYGIRLLAVLQSPSQLREAYGEHLADEIMSNCGAEVIFAPKDIRLAQALSERLGYLGQRSFSRSRPLGLGSGRRSITESEQRRPLMLPQELIALPDNHLIVLRSGVAPVRGRKLRYYRLRAFKMRLRPPPRAKIADDGEGVSHSEETGPRNGCERGSQLLPMGWSTEDLSARAGGSAENEMYERGSGPSPKTPLEDRMIHRR